MKWKKEFEVKKLVYEICIKTVTNGLKTPGNLPDYYPGIITDIYDKAFVSWLGGSFKNVYEKYR